MGVSQEKEEISRLILLYKGLKGATSISTYKLILPMKRRRNLHSLTFQTPFQELIFTRANSSLQ